MPARVTQAAFSSENAKKEKDRLLLTMIKFGIWRRSKKPTLNKVGQYLQEEQLIGLFLDAVISNEAIQFRWIRKSSWYSFTAYIVRDD